MPSSLTWLDYSDAERRRMREVIDLFAETGILDELGLGVIRDAIADALFPGTSTIQTRARYFLFIPWLYKDGERRRVPSNRIAEWRRDREFDLTDRLLETGGQAGVFGAQSRRTLKRPASEVYWLGLSKWGIRLCVGSQEQYHRSLDAIYRERSANGRRYTADDDDFSIDKGFSAAWHPSIPAAPDGFPHGATMALTKDEAQFLSERIRVSCPGTFLDHMIGHATVGTPRAPWEHAAAATAPTGAALALENAEVFSTVMLGATLLYNHMLASALPNDEWMQKYAAELLTWTSTAETNAERLRTWNLEQLMLTIPGSRRASEPSKAFVRAWHRLVVDALPGHLPELLDSPAAHTLVGDRERQMKRIDARLDNRRALERWSGASGVGQLTYRWSVIQTLVGDINAGLISDA